MATADLTELVQNLSSQVDAALGERTLGKHARWEPLAIKGITPSQPPTPLIFADALLNKLRRVSGQNKLVEVDLSSDAMSKQVTLARSTIFKLKRAISDHIQHAFSAPEHDVPASPDTRECRGSTSRRGSASSKHANEDEATNEQVCQLLLAGRMPTLYHHHGFRVYADGNAAWPPPAVDHPPTPSPYHHQLLLPLARAPSHPSGATVPALNPKP